MAKHFSKSTETRDKLRKGDLEVVYAISFQFSKCSTFPASWGHGQSYASISHTLLNCTQYLDTYH